MPRSIHSALLLLLTSACAQTVERPAQPATPTASEVDAFRQLGVDAPATQRAEERPSAPLDLERIAEAFATPKTMTPEEAERLRGVDAIVLQSSESETRTTGGDNRPRPPPPAVRAPEPVVATPPAEKPADPKQEPETPEAKPNLDPADPAKATMQPESGKFGKSESKKDEKEKDSDGEGGEKRPTTLLANVSRRPTSARILVETESGMKALVPRAIHTTVWVQGARARTVIDYVFENPHERRLEGTFFQPMPADASPAGFTMFDGTRRVDGEAFFRSARLLPPLGEGIDPSTFEQSLASKSKGTVDWGAAKDARVVGHQRARQVYEEIVRKNVDPALMELGGGGDFEARVFPLEPKSLKRVVIAYEQTLPFDGAAFQYGFTMPSESTIVDRAAELFADSSHGQVIGPAGLAPKTKGRWLRWSVPHAKAGEELALAIRPPQPQVVLRGRDQAGLPGEAFFVAVRPEIQETGDRATGRAILMIDTSLSSEEGGAYKRRAGLIRALLEKDSSIEQYAVMLFDVRPRWLHAIGWRDNTPENRRATAEELERVSLEGATNFAGALAELTRQRSWAVDGAPTSIFLLSDGHITWGLDRPEALPQRYPIIRDARFLTYQFGEESSDRSLFDLLSRESGGRTIALLSEAEIDRGALAHRRAPAELIGVEVAGAKAVDVMVSGDPKLLFPGQLLVIGGRLLEPKAATLSLRYRSEAGEKTIEVPLRDQTADDRFAARAFAELHARRLIALDDPRLDKMVVALSQHYRLANARASFLIVDSAAQVEEYRLADENLDLGDLLRLREQEQETRAREAVGLSLDGVPKQGLAVLEILRRRADGLPPAMLPQPLLDAPFAGGSDRARAEVDYRKQRSAERMSYLLYEQIARTRAFAGDTFGAVRALSSVVELRPKHGESMRLVGYALLALAQYDPAVELFERLRILRTFEGEAYLEEALALDAAGRVDRAAESYEILLARDWARHDSELTVTARTHYARLLRSVMSRAELPELEAKAMKQRLGELESEAADLTLTTHWSSDQVDIDLWVYEPSGEKCFYQQKTTQAGGELYWDTTDGLGPELYQSKHTKSGSYDSMVHYYGSSAPRLAVPAALLVVVDKGVQRSFLMRVLPERDVVLMLRTDVFE